jgi:hypothetical protein
MLCNAQVEAFLTFQGNMEAIEEAIKEGDSGNLASLLAVNGVRPDICAFYL